MNAGDSGGVYELFNFIANHVASFFTVFSTLIISFWNSFHEKCSRAEKSLEAISCAVTSLALLGFFKFSGLHEDWWPIIGIAVGFIGVARIRLAIISAWDSRKYRDEDDGE